MDFGTPQNIQQIKFAAGIDNTGSKLYIKPNHTYKLAYWDNTWISLGTQTAITNKVTFHDVPKNALFILRDQTSEVDERIFTYENNVIRWF